MKLRKTLVIGMTLIAAVIALDAWAQSWAFTAYSENGIAITVTPFFNLVRVWNSGISFGMFQQLPYGQWILSLLALVIIAVLTRLLWRTTRCFQAVAYGLIIGGAVGNVLDRILHGAVADYLDFHAFGYHWPAFNITDSAICIGVGLLLIDSLLPGFEQNKQKSKRKIA